MKKSKFYVCPICGNVSICSGNAQISCCGRTLEPLEPQKAAQDQRLTVEQVEDEWYVTSGHPMTKEHHIAFLAFATGTGYSLSASIRSGTCLCASLPEATGCCCGTPTGRGCCTSWCDGGVISGWTGRLF